MQTPSSPPIPPLREKPQLNLQSKAQWRALFREWVWPYLLVALVVIPLRSAVADSNWVPTGSMKPTVLEGDLLYVNKLAYDLRVPLTLKRIAHWADPAPGEIVVFFSPEDGKRLVKRVIAKPGDTVEMRQSVLIVNGRPLAYEIVDVAAVRDEIYEDPNPVLAIEHGPNRDHQVMAFPARPALRDFSQVTVPAEHYFMMGDSRDNSYDSRYFGFVPRKQIVGRAQGVIVSFDMNRHYGPRLARFFDSI